MIDIVIVNWNSKNLLRSCVESIEENGIELINKIVVVDNASSDGSEAEIDSLPKVQLVRNGTNLGFGKACNLGAELVDSEFVLFLNPDTRIFPNALSRVLDYMLQPARAEVGICGIQLVDEEGNIARHSSVFPKPAHYLGRSLGLHLKFSIFDHIMSNWDHSYTREVDHVIAAFYFVRTNLFRELGGFDERFFVYLEDIDFSYRAKQRGWLTHYFSDVQSMHVAGGTSNQIKARRLFYSLRSRILYSYKHYSSTNATLILLSIFLLEPFPRTVQAILARSFRAMLDTAGGFILLWLWLPSWIFWTGPKSVTVD